MNQWKRRSITVLSLFISCCCTMAVAQQEPEFSSVSPLMTQQPATNTTTNVNPDVTNSPADVNTADSPLLTSSTSLASISNTAVDDPYEKINRAVFNFNDFLDTYVLVPVSTFYNKVMPKPLNRGVYNFFSNLNNFPTIGNDVLQGNFYQATSDSWRLLVNSTAGAGGLFDVASNMGLEPNTEDFGLTLARWGYTNSSYVVMPLFGPSTVRDSLGLPVDYFLLSPYRYVTNSRTLYTMYALNIVSKRAHLLQDQDLYNQIALDRYAFIRNAYLQQRANAIERNQHLSDPYLNLTSKKTSPPATNKT